MMWPGLTPEIPVASRSNTPIRSHPGVKGTKAERNPPIRCNLHTNSKHGYCLGISGLGKYDQGALSLPSPKASRPPNPSGVPRLFVGHVRPLKGLTTLRRDFLLVLGVSCRLESERASLFAESAQGI
jgi:hypothetical protein